MARLIQSIRNAAVLIAAVASLAACSPTAPPNVVAASAPEDKVVVLTVTGAIGNSNRGPLDENRDAFLGHRGVKFDRAFEFTRASLAALGEHELKVQRSNWPAPVIVRGPYFRDVLAAVKAEGNTVALQALDGYTAKFPVAALQDDAVILAIEADGAPLSIGGRGPTWLVFPAGVVPGSDDDGDGGLVWSAYYLEVMNE